MKFGIGHMIVAALTALGIVAMVTGHNGELLKNIVLYIAGLGTGSVVAVAEEKRKE